MQASLNRMLKQTIREKKWFGIAIFLACLISGIVVNAAQRDTEEVVVKGQKNLSKWYQAESQHFTVISDATQEDVGRLLNQLERFDFLLRAYSQIEIKADKEPKFALYYFANASDLKKIHGEQPSYAIALYNSCVAGAQGFVSRLDNLVEKNTDLGKKHQLNESLSYLFEGYARHFIYRHTDLRTPTWFIDGFAQYFASARFADNQFVVGKAPTSISDYLLFLSDGHWYSLDYTDVLNQNDSEGHNFAGTAGIRLEFETKSWLLTHYILSSGENLKRFRDYSNLIKQDMPPVKAFEKAFGFKVSKINYKMWEYRHGNAKSIVLNAAVLPTADISFSTLPKSANDLLIQDAILKSCPTPKAGEALLQKITAQVKDYPNSDYAQLILSRAQIDWGNPQDSIASLTKITQNDASNFDAFLLLGSAQVRLAEKNSGATKENYLTEAQRNLLRALSLNAQSSEALFTFYKAGILRETPSEEALGSSLLAWQYAHEVNAFARSSALVYAYLGRTQDAQNILSTMAHNIRDPQMAEWAKTWKSKINDGVKTADILAEMRTELSPATPFKEWTIANEFVLTAIKTASALEDAQNVILTEKDVQQTKQMMGTPGMPQAPN